ELVSFFFFFQAEDGIRDDLVTGVQTCALPISRSRLRVVCPDRAGCGAGYSRSAARGGRSRRGRRSRAGPRPPRSGRARRRGALRSEERRVGEGGRCGGGRGGGGREEVEGRDKR